MWSSVLWALGITLVLFGCWVYLGSRTLGSDKRRWDAEHFISSMLFVSANGGHLRIEYPQWKELLRVKRVSGDTRDVVLSIEIPKSRVDAEGAVRLNGMVEDQQLGAELDVETDDGEALAFREAILVEDIWDEGCGAETARVVHLLLDSIGVGPEERLDYRIEGRRKVRREPD